MPLARGVVVTNAKIAAHLAFDIARSLHKVLGVPAVSSRKHQYSSGRFQYILDSNLTAVYLLQLFLCQLLSLLAVHFILLHNRINFKLLNLLVQRYDKFRQISNI